MKIKAETQISEQSPENPPLYVSAIPYWAQWGQAYGVDHLMMVRQRSKDTFVSLA